MAIVRFSDQFVISRKLMHLSDAAFRLHTEVICWCVRNRTQEITEADVRSIARMRHPAKHVAAIVAEGLWLPTPTGWFVPRGDDHFTWWSVERDDYRKKIPEIVRRHVFDRDGNRCVECGATEDLTLDHIYPWSLGGSDTEDNLRTLCRSCNSSKGARI